MHLDSAEARGEGEALSPMGIADHPLFTPREKLDLLSELRGEISRAGTERPHGFTIEQIDRAIAEVRRRVEQGAGEAFKGDA